MIQALSQSDMLCNLSKMCSPNFCQRDMHLTRARFSVLLIKNMECIKKHGMVEGIVHTTSRIQALNDVKHG